MPRTSRSRFPYKFVSRETSRHGRVCFYFKKRGTPRVRLPDPGNEKAPSAVFMRAYKDALAGNGITALPRKRGRDTVYFIGDDEVVKIGFSRKVTSRLRTLQTGTDRELAILFAMDGTVKDELAMHARFRRYAIRNEWFKREGKLAEFLRDQSPTRTRFEESGTLPEKVSSEAMV